MSFIEMLKDYAEHHIVYICANPKEILQVAKENKINLTVMSYEQVKSITEFKFPVAIDNYTNFIEYLFPVLNLYEI